MSDFISQFSKQLGLRALNYEHFERVLAGGWEPQLGLCLSAESLSLSGAWHGLGRPGWGCDTWGAGECQLGPAPALCAMPRLVACHPLCARADAASQGGGGGGDDDYTAAALHAVYERLLHAILEDLRAEEEASAAEKRWGALLSGGTWPEVLRRFVLTRNGAEEAAHL